MIKLDDLDIVDKISKLILKIHKIAYTSAENTVNSVFSCDISVAESVRIETEKFEALFHEIEAAIRDLPAMMGRHLLTIASSLRRIYNNSLDMADLVVQKIP